MAQVLQSNQEYVYLNSLKQKLEDINRISDEQFNNIVRINQQLFNLSVPQPNVNNLNYWLNAFNQTVCPLVQIQEIVTFRNETKKLIDSILVLSNNSIIYVTQILKTEKVLQNQNIVVPQAQPLGPIVNAWANDIPMPIPLPVGIPPMVAMPADNIVVDDSELQIITTLIEELHEIIVHKLQKFDMYITQSINNRNMIALKIRNAHNILN